MNRFVKVAAAALTVAAFAGTTSFAHDHGGDRKGKRGGYDRDFSHGQIEGLTTDPSQVTSGTYGIDSGHTTVQWEVSHMGLSLYDGRFNSTSGTLELDAGNIENSKLSVTIETASVDTPSDKLDAELRNEAFLAGEFPQITFTSTKIERKGDKRAKVTGDLTVKGVTKPVTLMVRFIGTGPHPFAKKETIGFQARGMIKRSDFGITNWSPVVGDSVRLDIAAELMKK